MTLPRTTAAVLADHVLFEIECVDRMYVNVYVPNLQYPKGLVGYLRGRMGCPIPSTAPLGAKSDAFAKAVRRFAAEGGIDWVDFKKGQRKDDIMKAHLSRFSRTEGVLFVGRAQEKARVFRTEKRRRDDGTSYPWIVDTTAVVNHYYFYCVDRDFGPFFVKFCGYFPYTGKLCLNGHEWAKRQATMAGIGFEALDNAFGAVDDVDAVQRICSGFSAGHIQALFDKWATILPWPFDAQDIHDGYGYELSMLQSEFSLTQVLDQPQSGRVFFEQAIKDNLDIGRPSQVSLIFGRRILTRGAHPTPGVFRTRVITDGVIPSLHVDYKTSTIKQYHKEGRALRTETTINNARDFGIGKRLTNLPALCEVGFHANKRLLDVQRISHDPSQGADILTHVTAPVVNPVTGTRTAGLRFTDPRVHDLFQALLMFKFTTDGFIASEFRSAMSVLHGEAFTACQVTYDLRRLKHHGFITRRPHSRRYDLTPQGLEQALFLLRAQDRFLRTGLAELVEPIPNKLNTANRTYQKALDDLARRSCLTG